MDGRSTARSSRPITPNTGRWLPTRCLASGRSSTVAVCSAIRHGHVTASRSTGSVAREPGRVSEGMNDDITVVIPCFNYGHFLEEAIHSALHQTGGAPAIIVVDDGSTDPGTQAVLEQLPEGVR